jgi:hypothetical protein
MRRLFLIIALCLIALPAMAQTTLSFQWDPMPAGQAWDNVRLYEVSGAAYALKGVAAGTATTITITGLTPGSHTYIVRAVSGSIESADSNSVSATVKPGSPANFKIVTVRIGEDGIVTLKLVDPSEFFRANAGYVLALRRF